jgi:anoctamin-8
MQYNANNGVLLIEFHLIFFYSSPTATSSSTQSMPKRTSSQPIEISEIPPYRKRDNQHSNYPPIPPGSSGSPQTITSAVSSVQLSSTPPKISEIPAFKQRRSKDMTPSEASLSQHRESHDSAISQIPEHQITIGPTGGAEWMRRLKVAEQSPIHRSTDCIVSKELGTSSDSELLKSAPSWSNVALKSSEQAGTSKIVTFIFKSFTIHFLFFI